MKTKIVMSGNDWRKGKYSTPEWERSVTIFHWEHNL